MSLLLAGIGFVLFYEGLVLALAPSLVERALQMLRDLPVARRRGIGAGAALLGGVLAWLASQGGAIV